MNQFVTNVCYIIVTNVCDKTFYNSFEEINLLQNLNK